MWIVDFALITCDYIYIFYHMKLKYPLTFAPKYTLPLRIIFTVLEKPFFYAFFFKIFLSQNNENRRIFLEVVE
jgi:hypothetical protein